MNGQSSGETTCKHCGQALPADPLGEICHACLLQEGLQLTDDDGPETALPTVADPESPAAPLRPDPLEGSTLGPGGRYKILQRLGEGGFGVVYMAEQSAPVRRLVALKILKAGMDTRQVVARFEAERQALAMMDHPNIAKVLDGGETEQGRPFFVMELVRGTPITAYCDREQLGPKARLRLFTQVCRAVQHAHLKGIIHRDLKPSNILVTVEEGAEPVPKVIDFGVAKALESNLTDKTLFTRFEQMIGTPAYMSPEQAGADSASDVDTRADIYALGVLLYELLSGTTPFDPNTLQRAAFEEVRRILREEEVPRPSARLSSLELTRRSTIAKERGTEAGGLGKLLRGDLDWIVMKAIEKDRRRRYETANALAADIDRHLADEPVSAGPPTAAYRTGKFLRRNRSFVATSLIAGSAILLGLTFAIQGYRAASSRAVEAERSRQEAMVEASSSEQILQFLLGSFFQQINPATNPDADTSLTAAVQSAADRMSTMSFDKPEVEIAIRRTIADAYRRLGKSVEAEQQLAVVARIQEESLGVTHPDTIAAKRAHAGALARIGRHAEAAAILKKTVPKWRETSNVHDSDSLKLRLDLARYLLVSGDHGTGAELLNTVYQRQRQVLGIEHPQTQESLVSLIYHYHTTLRDPERAREYESAISFSVLLHEGSTEALLGACRPHNRYGLDYEAHGAALRERAERSMTTFGPRHPEALSLRLAYILFLRATGHVEEGLEWSEDLLTDMRARLDPGHEWVLRLGADYLVAAFKSGCREEVRETANEMMAPLLADPRACAPREDRDLLPHVYFGIYGPWQAATEFYSALLGKGAPVERYNLAAISALGSGDLGTYRELVRQTLSQFGQSAEPAVLISVVEILLAARDLPASDAPARLEAAAELLRRIPNTHKLQPILSIRLALSEGDYPRLKEVLAESRQSLSSMPVDIWHFCWVRLAEAAWALESGQRQGAYNSLVVLREMVESMRAGWFEYIWWEILPVLSAAEALAGSSGFPGFADWKPTAYIHEPTDRYLERTKVAALEAKILDRCQPFLKAQDWTGIEPLLGELKAIAFRSKNTVTLLQVATVLARRQDRKDYDRFCREVFDGFPPEDSPYALERTAKVVLFKPCTPGSEELEEAYRRATRALELWPDNLWLRFTAALAAYRKGLAEEAATYFGEVEVAPGGGLGESILVLKAMIAHELQGTVPARALLEEARAIISSQRQNYGHVFDTRSWPDILASHVLFDEAELLMQGLPSRPRKTKIVLISPDKTWRWLHPRDGAAPAKGDGDFHQNFASLDFDDSDWATGVDSPGANGGFGYGDEGFAGVDLGAPLAKGLGKAAYFRHRFTTEREHANLELHCRRDDGIIVYLDGVEVARSNMMDGKATHDLPAKRAVSGMAENFVIRVPLEGTALSPGEHILAISLHNHGAPSSDLRIGEISLVEVGPQEVEVGE